MSIRRKALERMLDKNIMKLYFESAGPKTKPVIINSLRSSIKAFVSVPLCRLFQFTFLMLTFVVWSRMKRVFLIFWTIFQIWMKLQMCSVLLLSNTVKLQVYQLSGTDKKFKMIRNDVTQLKLLQETVNHSSLAFLKQSLYTTTNGNSRGTRSR